MEENNAFNKVENIKGKNAEKERIKQQKKRIKEIKKDEKDKARLLKKREYAAKLAEYEKEESDKFQAKIEKREKMKEQKIKDKEERRKINARHKTSKYERAVTAIISLSVISFLLIVALTYVYLMPQSLNSDLSSVYEKSFYNTVDQVDNIDVNLSKAIVTSDKGALQKYLVNTAINSEICENEIQQLPLQDESKFYTTKLINQIGDFCKYLNNKLIDGEDMTVEDYNTLVRLYNANVTLKDTLQTVISEMGEEYDLVSVIDGKNNVVLSNFNTLQNLSAEYPELIYDGPFSDGAYEREIKGLNGEEIDSVMAEELFTDIFGEYGIKDIKSKGESEGTIPCFNVEADVKGEKLYAQFAKKGGALLMFAYSGSCREINFTRDQAEEKAGEFLEYLGLTDMKPVWLNLSSNVYTINYAYEDEGIIVYSDLIKVRVCAETGMVIGIEATSYYTNHTERNIGEATVSIENAGEKVNENIEIETVTLCVVPIGLKTERLAYEFSGRYEDNVYFVYIDAVTGKQIQMFRVIDSEQGELLI